MFSTIVVAERLRSSFADEGLPPRVWGARLGKIAVELSLEPSNGSISSGIPRHSRDPRSRRGTDTFLGVPKPEMYQVPLSAEASEWLCEGFF
jgi:hypothetical protein